MNYIYIQLKLFEKLIQDKKLITHCLYSQVYTIFLVSGHKTDILCIRIYTYVPVLLAFKTLLPLFTPQDGKNDFIL